MSRAATSLRRSVVVSTSNGATAKSNSPGPTEPAVGADEGAGCISVTRRALGADARLRANVLRLEQLGLRRGLDAVVELRDDPADREGKRHREQRGRVI